MQFRKIIQRRIRRASNGVEYVGDINAAVSANVGERHSVSRVSSRSSVATGTTRRDEEESGDRNVAPDKPGH